MSTKSTPYPIESRRWLSRADAAGYLGISPDQFDKKLRGRIAEIIEVGDSRFDREDIDRYMERSKVREV